jgi:hypothetical protein
MTLETLYPVSAPYLATIRDPIATVDAKRDAALWLIERGFDQVDIAPKDEIMRAYYGDADAKAGKR